jgi:hypothetical protein
MRVGAGAVASIDGQAYFSMQPDWYERSGVASRRDAS